MLKPKRKEVGRAEGNKSKYRFKLRRLNLMTYQINIPAINSKKKVQKIIKFKAVQKRIKIQQNKILNPEKNNRLYKKCPTNNNAVKAYGN